MRRLRRLWRRFAGAAGRGVDEAGLSAEFEEHLRMQTEDNIRLGMRPEEARRQAVLAFGSVEAAKESYRDQRGLPGLQGLMRDVRYAARTLRNSPGFTLSAGLSLALGIAATTALFSSLVNATLLRPLPYRSPERIATVLRTSRYETISAPYFLEFRRSARTLESAALYLTCTFKMAGPAEPERIPGARISAELFDVLGVQPALGRSFTPEEDREGGAAVVLIGDALWRRRFAADPTVVGRKLVLNGAPHTVVGVMPPSFAFPEGPEEPAGLSSETRGSRPAQMWRPMALSGVERTGIGMLNYAMIARLRAGARARQAEAELNAIGERVWRDYGGNSRRARFSVATLTDTMTRATRVPVLILFAAVSAALLLACVNVASLLLARGLRRRPEIALRIALGASRLRIVRQLLTEALVLAFGAGCLALPLSWWAMRGLAAIAPAEMAGLAKAGFDLRMLGFAAGLTLLTALLAGAVPAFSAAWHAPGDLMRSEGRTATASPSRLRKALLAGEFALALMLLVAAGLLARSFLEVSRTPLGFHAENILTMRSSLPDYDGARRAALIEQLAGACSNLPGVVSAAAVSTLPLTGDAEGWGVVAEGNPDSRQGITVRVRAVTPSYFRTMGIPIRSGRAIAANDRGAPEVGVVSEAAARYLWAGVADPVGRRLVARNAITVVGIAGDTRASGLDRDALPYLYVPFSQFPSRDYAVAVRTHGDPAALVAAVKAEIRRIDKDQPITDVAIMRQLVADSIAPRRFQALLMALFAGFALILAALGIYGVVAYSVARRTHEIGIRIALGASRFEVVAAVVKESAGLAVLGIVLGLGGSLALTRLLRSLLYGVSATDPAAFCAAAATLAGVAAAAALVPAARAARSDPARCLRAE